ncbi:MAG: lysophospholipid acyltransferase family protein [Candidatus Omnitrophica bacterium]|nr:lysophospholipid acyltransferase family protein [Candidatus Omnitrophota bacterium]
MRIIPPYYLKKFLNQLSIMSLKLFLGLMRILPRWCVQGLVGVVFSLAYLWIKGLKKICKKNLLVVYGQDKTPEQYEIMMKECFRTLGDSMIDMLYYVNRPQEFSEVFSIHGEECLKKAQKKAKGVVCVTAHLGNFPLMFMGLVQKGYKVNVIIRPMRDKDFSEFMFGLCSQWGINMIQTAPKKQFIKKTLACLQRNELLFILLDEVVPKESGVDVDFLNCKVTRSVGPVLFYERLGSAIVPMFVVKDHNGHFDIFIEKELAVENNFSSEENTIRNISSLSQTIEFFVKKYPLQWGGWLNKRWAQNRP